LQNIGQLVLEEEAIGGGPENPIADVVAAGTLVVGGLVLIYDLTRPATQDATTTVCEADQTSRNQIPVYRVGNPDGRWWATTDPRTDPDFFEHYGMSHSDNPGTPVTVGYVNADEVGKTWVPSPASDYNQNSLNNGYVQVYIPNPRLTVQNPVSYPWNPQFFR